MPGAGDGHLSSDLLDDILWSVENGLPTKRRRTSPSQSPSLDDEPGYAWFEGHGPIVANDDVLLLSSDGCRLTAKLDFLLQHSTFFDDLSEVPQPEGARVALPPIELDATGRGIDVVLKALAGIVNFTSDAVYSDSGPPRVPSGPDRNLRISDTIHAYRLSDYLDCRHLRQQVIDRWKQFKRDTLLELLAACSRLDDVPVARVVIALSYDVFGRIDLKCCRVSYAAANWSHVVSKLKSEWQVELFHAFWEQSEQLVARPIDQLRQKANGRKVPRRKEHTYVDARRTAQQIADLFFASRPTPGSPDGSASP